MELDCQLFTVLCICQMCLSCTDSNMDHCFFENLQLEHHKRLNCVLKMSLFCFILYLLLLILALLAFLLHFAHTDSLSLMTEAF